MKSKAFCFIFSAIFFCGTAFSQEELAIKENAFGYPEGEIISIITNNPTIKENNKSSLVEMMPDCNDENLVAKIKEELKPYLLQNENVSIYDYRRRQLIIKNIKNFTIIDAKNINIKEDMAAADRVIELKISERIPREDIKICKAFNKITGYNIYIVMYFQKQRLIAEVVNFTNKEKIFFEVEGIELPN